MAQQKSVVRIAPNNPVLFTRTYDWMKVRGLTEGGGDHATLIAR